MATNGTRNHHSLALNTPQPGINYVPRESVRCIIVLDAGTEGQHRAEDKICIIRVARGNYYKLPGGGIEPNDVNNDLIACIRECLEETGCAVIVHKMFATTREYRGDTEQISRAYVCVFRQQASEPALTAEEQWEGLVHYWMPIREALEKMKEIQPMTEFGRMIQRRDVWLVEKFLELSWEEKFESNTVVLQRGNYFFDGGG